MTYTTEKFQLLLGKTAIQTKMSLVVFAVKKTLISHSLLI